MLQENAATSNFELIIRLIEVIIWPVTLLAIFILFRKNFEGAFKRLGALKADSSGISLTFEKELEKAKSTFEIYKPEEMAIGKSNLDIQSINDPPYQQLMTIKKSLEKALIDLATEEEIEVSSKSFPSLCDALTAKGIINPEKSELTQSLLKVVNLAGTNITSSQIHQIKKMYNAL